MIVVVSIVRNDRVSLRVCLLLSLLIVVVKARPSAISFMALVATIVVIVSVLILLLLFRVSTVGVLPLDSIVVVAAACLVLA